MCCEKFNEVRNEKFKFQQSKGLSENGTPPTWDHHHFPIHKANVQQLIGVSFKQYSVSLSLIMNPHQGAVCMKLVLMVLMVLNLPLVSEKITLT